LHIQKDVLLSGCAALRIVLMSPSKMSTGSHGHHNSQPSSSYLLLLSLELSDTHVYGPQIRIANRFRAKPPASDAGTT